MFYFMKVLLVQLLIPIRYSYQFFYFFLFYISFYISRYHYFSQAFFFWICYILTFWRYFLYKFVRSSRQFFSLLLFYISFHISRYYFSQAFRTLFKIIWKKIFVTDFLLLTDCLKPSHPFNGQNPQTVTKRFRWCFLTLEHNFRFSKV